LMSSLPLNKKLNVLAEIWEDAYEGKLQFPTDINRLKEKHNRDICRQAISRCNYSRVHRS